MGGKQQVIHKRLHDINSMSSCPIWKKVDFSPRLPHRSLYLIGIIFVIIVISCPPETCMMLQVLFVHIFLFKDTNRWLPFVPSIDHRLFFFWQHLQVKVRRPWLREKSSHALSWTILFLFFCFFSHLSFQFCGIEMVQTILQELGWTKLIFHALHMIIFTSELGNLPFLLFTNGSQLLFALQGLLCFGLLWKYSCGCRAELRPFLSTLFFSIYFILAGGAHQQGRLIWLPSAPFSGVACPLPSLLSHQSVAVPQIVSPGAPWVAGDEEEGGSDTSVALNCYRSSDLNALFFKSYVKSPGGLQRCGGRATASRKLLLFRDSFVATRHLFPFAVGRKFNLTKRNERLTPL